MTSIFCLKTLKPLTSCTHPTIKVTLLQDSLPLRTAPTDLEIGMNPAQITQLIDALMLNKPPKPPAKEKASHKRKRRVSESSEDEESDDDDGFVVSDNHESSDDSDSGEEEKKEEPRSRSNMSRNEMSELLRKSREPEEHKEAINPKKKRRTSAEVIAADRIRYAEKKARDDARELAKDKAYNEMRRAREIRNDEINKERLQRYQLVLQGKMLNPSFRERYGAQIAAMRQMPDDEAELLSKRNRFDEDD